MSETIADQIKEAVLKALRQALGKPVDEQVIGVKINEGITSIKFYDNGANFNTMEAAIATARAVAEGRHSGRPNGALAKFSASPEEVLKKLNSPIYAENLRRQLSGSQPVRDIVR